MIQNGLTADRFYKMPMQMVNDLIEYAVECAERLAGNETVDTIEGFDDLEKLAEKLNT